MDVLEIVRTEIGPAIGLPTNGLTITPRPPLEIQSNRLYDVWADGRHFIAKEYLQANELESAPLREYQALRMLSPLDIAPQPVFYDPILGPIVIYEYMPGEMWDRKRPTASDLSKLRETWLKIQDLPVDWLARGSERHLQDVEMGLRAQFQAYLNWAAGEFLPGKQAAELCLNVLDSRHAAIQELSEYEPLPCFCRSDPRFANVIQRPNGSLGLVDWEDSGLRDPAREAADVIIHPNQEDLVDWQDWQVFLEPYLAVHGRSDRTVARRMHLYLALFPMFWSAIILTRGLKRTPSEQSTNRSVNGLAENIRLRRYLARAIAWPNMNYQDALEKLSAFEFFPSQ